MKNLLYLLLATCLFVSCSEDDNLDKPDEPGKQDNSEQDYTSYEFVITGTEILFETMISGYFNADGECILLCDHGDHSKGGNTIEFIMPEFHEEIFLFYGFEGWGDAQVEKAFKPKRNVKNTFIIPEEPIGLPVYKRNIYNWPH